MPPTAVCCCGPLRLTVTSEPAINGVCHCTDCKRRTGSAFGWQVYFRDEAIVALAGAMTSYVVGAPTQLPWNPKGTRRGIWAVAIGPLATSRASNTRRSLRSSEAR